MGRAGVRGEKTHHAAFPKSPHALHTTLDLELNHFAERTLRQHLARLRAQHVRHGAVVVLDNRTGGVLALVGSDDFFSPDAGQVNGAWAARSAGSTLKPFTYLLAFEQGATPASVVADLPAEFATSTGIFAPVNYNHRCYGPMRYRLALANSLNISAVKVLATIGGPEVLLRRLRECGLTTLCQPADYYGLGLTIGNAEVRLLELANAYACLARLGEWKPFKFWTGSQFRVSSSELSGALAFDAGAAWLIADILSDNDARAFTFGIESPLRFHFPVACKTGTSSDFRDNWALGYTPEFTVGVWVGNFDGTPMERVSGVSGAAPILHDLFEHLHARYGTTWYPRPTNIVERPVHAVTGKLFAIAGATPSPLNGERIRRTSSRIEPLNPVGTRSTASPTSAPQSGTQWNASLPVPVGRFRERAGARGETNQPPTTQAADVTWEKFLAGQLPPAESAGDYDAAGRVLLPAEYAPWLCTGDNWLAGRAAAAPSAPALRLIAPLPGTVIFLDPDLPASSRQLPLKAEAPAAVAWHSDSLICQAGPRGPFAVLTEGRHHLVVRCAQTGAAVETWIEVKAL
jgi:penicillin-binding protein 1C